MWMRYIRRCAPEWLLCAGAAAALCGNVLEGFVLPEAMYTAWLPLVLLSLALTAVLYAVSYSRRTLALGIPTLVVLAAVTVFVCYRLGIPLIETAEAEDNAGLWYLVVCLTVVVVFCLSRTTGGSAVLCLLGALANGWICLSLYPFYLPCLVIFLVLSVAMLSLCRYRQGMLRHSTRQSGWMAMIGISLAAAAASVLVAAVLWFGVLSGMELPTQDVNLITRIVSLEVLEKIGVSKTEILLDEKEFSDNMDPEFEEVTDEMEEETTEELEDEAEEVDGGNQQDADTPVPQGMGQAMTYGLFGLLTGSTVLTVATGLLLFLLLVGGILRFLLRHWLWLRRLQKRHPDPAQQVEQIYHRLHRRLPLLGMPGAGTDTPLEYARRIQRHTAVLDEEGASWLALSQCFSRLCYGGIAPEPEELEAFVAYYRSFYRQAPRLCGFHYLWRQFRL